MAVMWSEDLVTGWVAAPLRRNRYDLGRLDAGRELSGGAGDELPGIRMMRSVEADDQWVLLTEPGAEVRVNGVLLSLGMRVLRHRDEVVASAPAGDGPRRWFFSGECIADVEPLPEEETPATCPSCERSIAAGTPAVRCPHGACGAWHHESDESPCWSTSGQCSLCETPAVLKPGARWSPEEL